MGCGSPRRSEWEVVMFALTPFIFVSSRMDPMPTP
jgi:hypothetical protein